MNNPEIERLCNQANERVAAKDYSSAVGLLEQVVKIAAVPAVFNNLGVLYAGLNDRSRSIGAFRDALARDINYRPVRANLYRMKDLMALGAVPVTREIESNDTQALANLIAPGKPVDGEIAAGVNDLDYFRVTTPPAPRDLTLIEVVNRSTTLAPVLKIFDAGGGLTNMGSLQREPGASIKLTISPPPNSTLFLELSGYRGSAGSYTLRVQPQKAFDGYEPNDEISRAADQPRDAGRGQHHGPGRYRLLLIRQPSNGHRERGDRQPLDHSDPGPQHILPGYAHQRLWPGHHETWRESSPQHGGHREPDLLPASVAARQYFRGIHAQGGVTGIVKKRHRNRGRINPCEGRR